MRFFLSNQLFKKRVLWILTTLLFITHVSTVVVAVTLPYAADAAAVRAAVLVGQTAVLWLEERKKPTYLLINQIQQRRDYHHHHDSAVCAHRSWRRCCFGAGSRWDIGTAALRWAWLRSGRHLDTHRCVGVRAEADTVGCTAGQHRHYGLVDGRSGPQFEHEQGKVWLARPYSRDPLTSQRKDFWIKKVLWVPTRLRFIQTCPLYTNLMQYKRILFS